MAHEVKPITIKKLNSKLPLIFNNKIILKKDLLPFKGNVKVIKSNMLQKDVLYEAKYGDFLAGDLSEICIVNHLYRANNACRTVATCKSLSGEIIEKTSDEITKLIGQNNYDNLFASLCSVINQELKIRGIYSLLTIPKSTKFVSCQTENYYKNTFCQTHETFIGTQKKITMKRRAKRAHLTPYVIPDTKEVKKIKRLVITPNNFEKILSTPDSIEEGSLDGESILPDLGPFLDDDSNNSYGRLSALSIQTTPDILLNPMRILDNVDKVTRKAPEIDHNDGKYLIHDLDKSVNLDKSKFHNCNDSFVKKENFKEELHNMSPEQRIKTLLQQGLNDYKNCLQRDESGHLPIHAAVLNNDVDLLKRQCLVLKMRGISVDIPADNLTPLRMALYQDNVQLTALLLQHNADALTSDTYAKTCFHVAAEMATDHLQSLVNHYQLHARQILEEDECLWKPEYANKTDTELSKILLNHINKLFDCHGYTPLMLASKFGRYENVKLLIESSPDAINIMMPSSGNTALYLAVGSACMDSAERGNKSKVVDHFKRTIEILVENGSDYNTPNFSGVSVNDLIAEHNIGEISMLIANKLTYRNFWEGKLPADTEKFDAFMLVKDEDGNLIKLEESQKSQTIKKNIKPAKKSIQKTINKPKKESKKITILKSETITGDKYKLPVISDITGNTSNKPDIIQNMPKIQNFKLNKPLVLKSVKNNNRKRKIEINIEPVGQMINTND